MIRTYRAKRQADAMQAAYDEANRDGLLIESSSWQEGRSGCLRFLLIGIFAFFWRPKGELTVVLSEAPHA